MHAYAITEHDRQLLQLALLEDLGKGLVDLSTQSLFADQTISYQAQIVSKESGRVVVCGTQLIAELFAAMNKTAAIDITIADGEQVNQGEVIAKLRADANALLPLERTILNFMRHLSGIATLTKQFVDQIKHTPCQILDTRKTTPGFRGLEKYAVQCGGGLNHRMGLYDAIMVKDTHVDSLGGMSQALAKLQTENRPKTIVEVRNQQELDVILTEALGKVDQVLLDNMSLDELRTCVDMVAGKLKTEASGNMSLERVAAVAETGVDYISVGCITHSAPQVDLSMRVV